MFCTNCGAQNAQGAAFCQNCGAPMGAAPAPAQQGMPMQPMAPMAPMGRPPKRKRPGLTAGLIIGGVVLLAGIVILVLWLTGVLFAAPGVEGRWYNDDMQETIEFYANGDVLISTQYGDFDGTYTFDKGSGSGQIKLPNQRFDFAVDGDVLAVEDIGRYKRETGTDRGFDNDNTASNGGDADAGFVLPGQTAQDMIVEQDEQPDLPVEQAVPNSSLLGMWYEETGYGGTLEFFADGTCTLTGLGMEFDGTYTFDAASGEGLITASLMGETSEVEFTFEDGRVYSNMAYYTKDYVYQMTLEEIMEELDG